MVSHSSSLRKICPRIDLKGIVPNRDQEEGDVPTKQTMRKNQRKDGENVREKFKTTSPVESQGNLVNRRSLVISIIIFHYEIAAG